MMADSRRLMDVELERALRDLGPRYPYPPTPNLASRVRLRITAPPVARPRRLELWRDPRRLALAAAVLLVLLGAAALANPAARHRVPWRPHPWLHLQRGGAGYDGAGSLGKRRPRLVDRGPASPGHHPGRRQRSIGDLAHGCQHPDLGARRRHLPDRIRPFEGRCLPDCSGPSLSTSYFSPPLWGTAGWGLAPVPAANGLRVPKPPAPNAWLPVSMPPLTAVCRAAPAI